MGHRWYDPQIGRFLTRDPSGAGDNPYAYCGNNPVTNLDPLGLQSTNGDGDSDPPFSITVSSGDDFSDPVSLVGPTGSSSGGGGSPSKPTQGPSGFIDRLTHGPYGCDFSGIIGNFFSMETWGGHSIAALQGTSFGDYLEQATPIAGQVAMALATKGVSAEAEFVGPSLGILEGKSGMVSEMGLSLVSDHLGSLDAAVYNDAMIGRLGNAMASGQPISGADLVFYTHELSEAQFMNGGMSYDEAHAAALGKYGVSPFAVYHPEVIAQYPQEFGSSWKRAWGLQ